MTIFIKIFSIKTYLFKNLIIMGIFIIKSVFLNIFKKDNKINYIILNAFNSTEKIYLVIFSNPNPNPNPNP